MMILLTCPSRSIAGAVRALADRGVFRSAYSRHNLTANLSRGIEAPANRNLLFSFLLLYCGSRVAIRHNGRHTLTRRSQNTGRRFSKAGYRVVGPNT